MTSDVLEGPLSPPPGRPSWRGQSDLPLLYLGWGLRDFRKAPLPIHCDHATNYYILKSGEFDVETVGRKRAVRGPAALLFDSDCAFGLTQTRRMNPEVLVWVWKGDTLSPELRPPPGAFLTIELNAGAVESLNELHCRSRKEVARADSYFAQTLLALRKLIEIEILRAGRVASSAIDYRWELASAWMMNNLSIHAPVPALCDYLRMSPSTLHRFFIMHVAMSPGAYFRQLKTKEALRLIREEGWQVKAAAYHLGYKHPNDLSRAIAGH